MEIKEAQRIKSSYGVDGGKNRLKPTMTIVNKNEDSKAKFKSSGAKRTIVLSCVQDMPENYWNLKL